MSDDGSGEADQTTEQLTNRQQSILAECSAAGISTRSGVRRLTGCGDHIGDVVSKVLRAKSGELTPMQLWEAKCKKLSAALGDRDPRAVTNREIAVACGMELGAVSRYMARQRKAWAGRPAPASEVVVDSGDIRDSLTPRQLEVFNKCLEAGVYVAKAIVVFANTGNDLANTVAKALRQHLNRKTKYEQWLAKCEAFDRVLGDRDPNTVTNTAFAKECGVRQSTVRRYMQRRRIVAKGLEVPQAPVVTTTAAISHADRAALLAKVLGSRDPRDVSLVQLAADADMSPHLVERWLTIEKRRMAIVDPEGKRRAPKPVARVRYNDGCDLPPPMRPPRGRRVKLVVNGDDFGFVEKQ